MQNVKGRVLFLGIPVAVGAAVHALLSAATGGAALIGPLAGAVAAVIAAGIVGWRLLDDDAGYAMVRKAYEPGMGVALLPVLGAMALSVGAVIGAAAVVLFFFGGVAALAPISEYADVGEPPRRDIVVARLAGALQGSLLLVAFCTPSPLMAAAVGVAVSLATAAAVAILRPAPAIAG